MQKKLLTATEVAEQLNVTERTIANYCDAGVFPGAFKLSDGKTSPWRIPPGDLENYLKKQRAQANKA